jgi:hypothetical protein
LREATRSATIRRMTRTARRSTFVFAATAATMLGLAAVGVASAATGTTEPTDTASMGTEAEGTAAPPAAGSAAPSTGAFCEAEVAAEAAANSEDPAVMGPAFEALVAAAPEDVRPAVDDVIANASAGPGDPAFDEAYGSMIDYMIANCGYPVIDVTAQEYAFVGIPEEIPAGPTIFNLTNKGEQVHEMIVFRISDDVDLPVQEILQLPDEETEGMAESVGGTFVLPGNTSHAVMNLTPGRHAALCFIPEGTTPENMDEVFAEEGTAPAGSAPAGSMPAEGSTPAGSASAGSMPAEGSTPAEGSAPSSEPPPHALLGMFQEFTVV